MPKRRAGRPTFDRRIWHLQLRGFRPPPAGSSTIQPCGVITKHPPTAFSTFVAVFYSKPFQSNWQGLFHREAAIRGGPRRLCVDGGLRRARGFLGPELGERDISFGEDLNLRQGSCGRANMHELRFI